MKFTISSLSSLTVKYGVCLFLVFILEVSASIAAFVMQGQVREMLVRTMNESLANYESNEYIQAGVDFMQSGLECCGVHGPRDWINFIQQSNSTDNRIDVPLSCCGMYSYDLESCEKQYENGCFGRMDFIISQSTMLIATGATTVAFVQVRDHISLDKYFFGLIEICVFPPAPGCSVCLYVGQDPET